MARYLYLLLSVLILVLGAAAQEPARLLRFPHVMGEKIAFVHGGDIWVCTSNDLRARRLTSHDDGFELMPRISPDGKKVAFSAEYGGTRQIYVVPWEGGVPQQLTFYPDVGPMPPRGGFDNLPYDWSGDSTKILFRSNRTPYGQRVGRYFLVDASGRGMPQALPVPEGGAVTMSPDGGSLAYNIISREWRTWKRYTAGRAQDVYLFDLKAGATRRLTSFSGTDSHPLWVGNKIYFTSDRTGTLNLWCHDLKDGKERAVTSYSEFDVLFPSRGGNSIVFENGGYIHHLDTVTDKVERLNITLADDRVWTRPVWKEGATRFSGYDLSPQAKRVAVEFRGDLFTAPAKNGQVRTIMSTPDRRERQPSWSPDGHYLAYLAEEGESYELFLWDRKTRKERQLTRASSAWILETAFSPDSKKIAVTDKAGVLRLVDVATGSVEELDRGKEAGLRGVRWSADSSHLTYVKGDRNGLSSVWITTVASPSPRRVTSKMFRDSSPAFSEDGAFLYFVSARDFKYEDRSFEQRVYALTLRASGGPPLPFLSDEEPLPGADSDGAKDGDQDVAAVKVDWEGVVDRLTVLPMPRGSYRGLTGVAGGLLYIDDDGVKHLSLKDGSTKNVLEGVRSYRTNAGAKNIVYRHRGKLCIDKPMPGRKPGSNTVDLTGVRVRIEPAREWRQMFMDAWRITRDWFYDPAMHRVDWQKMRARYEPLTKHMSHRSDLDYILGELIGELNVGHAYVQSGELPRVEREPAGCLGCEFEVVDGRYRIARIFSGENWTSDGRSPLTEVGVAAGVGEFLLAIDGQDVTADDNPYRLLEGKADRRVTLTLAKTASGADRHDEIVKPIRSEVRLRYLDWVAANARLVAEKSNGRIGYIHVPNTAVEGHRRFYEGFDALAREKEALIIDDRYNGGGFIPDRMAHDLAAKPLNYWSRRSTELYPTPGRSFGGPSVMLINGYSSSGGDAFPYYYRKLGAGPLIGSTTWGGLVGISFEPGLVDGGRIRVPSFAFVDTDGRWAVEAEGVEPDKAVFDDPGRIAAGEQPVLEAGIAHLMKVLGNGPANARPKVPTGPKRN